MKKKNLKTLKLEKQTVSQLDFKSKQQIVGGATNIDASVCLFVCQWH